MLPAGGRGTRFGGDKLFAEVAGRPLVGHTLRAAGTAGVFDAVVIAAPPHHWERLRSLAAEAGFDDCRITVGGERRQESVARALEAIGTAEIVTVHDAARPLCAPRLFSACVAAAREHGAATVAVPVVETIKRVASGLVVETLPRGTLYATQTPQSFRGDLLAEAHAQARRLGTEADDDAGLVESLGVSVRVVLGSPDNVKVTHPRDLAVLRSILGGQ